MARSAVYEMPAASDTWRQFMRSLRRCSFIAPSSRSNGSINPPRRRGRTRRRNLTQGCASRQPSPRALTQNYARHLLRLTACGAKLRLMPSEVRSPLKHGRLRRGMTLQELAEKCAADGAPVSESALSRIERGRQTPRPRLRSVLARVLDLDVDDFDRNVPVEPGTPGSAA
ncbi:multiprotein-bridging factor 1 family protein [Streptomyces sp. NPDC005774]|uniref:helix-turn-helix domain-containing protein n=1 Tax=Streptomyces sp. NPDC005774 TaxID=3364728 RepID=UPI003687E2DB